MDVVRVTHCSLPPVQRQHLLTQLPCPFPFRLPRSLHPKAGVLLMTQRLLTIAEPALQLAPLASDSERLAPIRDTGLGFALFLQRRLLRRRPHGAHAPSRRLRAAQRRRS